MDTGKGPIVVKERRRAIRLPLKTIRDNRLPVRAMPRERAARPVLLAEHNRISQRLLRRILARLGCEVCLADSCEQALEIFRRRPSEFAMVILDLKAPLDGGIEILKRWPGGDDSCSVPIIALGNDPSSRAREACLEAGARIYLTEALRDERLSRAIRSLSVSVGETARAAPEPALPAPPPEAAGLLNEKAFQSLLELSPDPAFIQELMDDFRRDGTGYFARMQKALKKRDAHGWHEALHALKGSAMGLGAASLAHLCARHESLSRDAIRAGEGYSEYAYILEVFNSTVQAMQEKARVRHHPAETDLVAIQTGA